MILTTADFIKRVLSVYTHSMTTIYLSQSAQVAKSTFFMKSPLFEDKGLTLSKMLIKRIRTPMNTLLLDHHTEIHCLLAKI